MESYWLTYLILFAAGIVAGTLNVVAGGGSFLTLPLLIFLGLPPTVANGTNRVAILVQNIGAVWGFNRHRIIEWRWLRLAAAPALVGAVLGTFLAVRIGDDGFRRALAVIMVVVTLWTLWDPVGRRARAAGPEPDASRASDDGKARAENRWLWTCGFFCVGVYGGFVQAGIGFLILAVATVVGLDLVRGNALKVLVVLVFTPVALAIFAANGLVDWGMGLALGAGNFLGGLVGVRTTILRGNAWIRRVVTIVIVVFAIKLWFFP